MSNEKISQWGRRLDAGEKHGPLLKLSRRLLSLQPQAVSAPADFREALLDDLLSKHRTLSVSTQQSQRVLTLDIVVAVMTLVLLVGAFIWNIWTSYLPSSSGSDTTPSSQPLAGSETTTGTPMASALQISPESCSRASASDLPHASLPLRPDYVLSGGTVQDGPFMFDLWLYCDPELGMEITPYLSIGGLGMHNAWFYLGPNIDGEVLYSYGIQPDVVPSTGWDQGLTTFSGAFNTGSFCCLEEDLLRQIIQSGELISFVVKVESEAGIYGAVLSFRLAETANGLDPQNVLVTPLAEEIW